MSTIEQDWHKLSKNFDLVKAQIHPQQILQMLENLAVLNLYPLHNEIRWSQFKNRLCVLFQGMLDLQYEKLLRIQSSTFYCRARYNQVQFSALYIMRIVLPLKLQPSVLWHYRPATDYQFKCTLKKVFQARYEVNQSPQIQKVSSQWEFCRLVWEQLFFLLLC